MKFNSSEEVSRITIPAHEIPGRFSQSMNQSDLTDLSRLILCQNWVFSVRMVPLYFD